MIAHITNQRYLDYDGIKITIGGVQTYITNLIVVLQQLGYEIRIYQAANIAFRKKLQEHVEVIGVSIKDKNNNSILAKKLTYEVDKNITSPNDIIIYGSDFYIFKSKHNVRTIGIQHGIFWDIPHSRMSNLSFLIRYIGKAISAWTVAERVSIPDLTVCVDNNFINWYRAITPYRKANLQFLPNFTEIPQKIDKPSIENGIKVIFARRLQSFRGTKLLASAMERILKEYDNVLLTIAGDGPDESFLKEKFSENIRVTFTTYKSEDSLKIHMKHHIAIIPTVGSEGTSLSLLEAMAARCAVICTNVGGMTNIILNKYNGIMISPDENELYQALKTYIDDIALISKTSLNAQETVESAFSLATWMQSWKETILKITV